MIKDIQLEQPDPDVIRELEGLLVEAKAGEITSLIYIIGKPRMQTGSAWVGMNKQNTPMLGELRVLERDLIDKLFDLRVDPQTGETSD